MKVNIEKVESDDMAQSRKLMNTMEILCRLIVAVLVRFWKLTSTGLLLIILVFWFQGGIIASVLLVVGILGLLYNAQDMLVYHPDQPPLSRMYVEMPSAFHLPYENHFIKTVDGQLINVVLIKHPQPNAPTLVYFHGNAGNIGHRLGNVLGLYSSCGFNVVQVEYRGYGKSSGSVSETGLYRDAEAAMDFVLKRSDIDQSKIIVFGRSLGGAVAIYLASHPLYAQHIFLLIVENTFTSMPEIARILFNFKFVHYLPYWAHKNKYPSQQRLRSMHVPMLFLSGLQDQLVPPSMMETLHASSVSSLRRLVRLEGGTHSESWMCPGYYEAIVLFVREVLQNRVVKDGGLPTHRLLVDCTVQAV